MKILLVAPKDISGVEYHRLIIPHTNLPNCQISMIEAIDHQPDSFFHDFDLIVTSSVLSKIGNQELVWKQVKKIGIPVVIDRDDTWQLPQHHPMKREWDNSNRAEQIVYNLKQADLVTTTTESLRHLIKQFNKSVQVLPNGIDFKQPQFQVDPKVKAIKTNGLIHIGWSGSVTHNEDFRLLEIPIYELLTDQETQEKYRLVLAGYVDKDPTWKHYENVFTSRYRLNERQYCRINSTDVYSYASAYDAMDIGLIPLISNHFNDCKSNLKMLEMGAKGLAVVVSESETYKNIAKNKVNCLTANKKTWFKQIKKLLQNPDLIQELSHNLNQEVLLNYEISILNKKRLELYQALCTRQNT